VVFQSYALFPHMSVAENIGFPLKMRKVGRAERDERTRRVLDMVKMAPFAERRPAQLSGGQQQRVALARALVFEPRLVLMDEPLGALDKQLREHMQLEIRHLHASLGVTVIYVTHDQSEAMTMSDRVAVFKDGVVRQVATPWHLYERPNCEFVAQFVGENNALVGTVVRRDASGCAVDVGGALVASTHEGAPEPGSRALVSLRPERVVINPDEGLANRLAARVEEVIYLGDHARIRTTVYGNREFVLKVSTRVMEGGLSIGDEIMIGWGGEDCRVLPKEA
jgi:putative spermidine/putrescine transport system ATP-binding protein